MQVWRDIERNIDWSIVVSGIATAVIIGGSVYAMRKVGLNTPAKIVSAGK